MFKVDSKFQYILHFASTKEIADAVRDDLASREECSHPEMVVIEDNEDKPAGWDPGGVLMINDKTFVFKLDNMSVEIKRQHFSYFIDWVHNAKLHEWFDTKYYKIHSNYLTCLCVTEDELKQLKEQIDDSTLALKATVSVNEYKEANSFMQVARVKDKNGEPGIVEIKREEPTLN